MQNGTGSESDGSRAVFQDETKDKGKERRKEKTNRAGEKEEVKDANKAILEALKDKDDKKAYALAKEIGAKSAETNEYYEMFYAFVSMLGEKSSYVRTRGFCLACAQARWDVAGKVVAAFDEMKVLLNDEKPTVVRQCLSALHEVVLYRPELSDRITEAVKNIDLSRYKDSMTPLIKKDADELLKMME